MLQYLKNEANLTHTENGAVTYQSTQSECLDLFATIGALRRESDEEITNRFLRAYAENADLAMKTLFFARDIRGGIGERRVFRTILRWLAHNEPQSVEKNIPYIAEYAGHPGSVVASFTAQPTADAPVFSQAATAPKSTQPAQQQVQPPVQQSHASAPEPPKTLDEYLRVMTIEQAKAVKVDFGRFSGWSLGEIAMKSPGDLAWYVKNYSGHNLALKAGATKLLETVGQMAS